ncbi:MAG: hypothetical protein Q9169_003542 [Polycauliona sp. 2 TL-2023]
MLTLRLGVVMDPASSRDEDRKDEKMIGTQNSPKQHVPSHYKVAANPVDGLSIKGAAARRRQAPEHNLSTGKGFVNQGNAAAALHMENTALLIPGDINGNGVPNLDISTVNTPGVNAEIASTGQRTSGSMTTPDLSPEHSRQGLRRKDKPNSPQLPSWLAALQASNPAKPLVYTGIHLPNSIQPDKLEAYSKSKEIGFIRRSGAAADANTFRGVTRVEAWVQDGEWPLPGESAKPQALNDLAKTKHDAVAPASSVTVPDRMVLRDQSTNFSPLPTPTSHSGRAETKRAAAQPPNQTPQDDSREQADGPPSYSRPTKVNNGYNRRLATACTSDFMSQATATQNSLRQPLSSQARSPLSTERTGEASPEVQKKIPSPTNSGSAIDAHEKPVPANVEDNVNKSQDVGGPNQVSVVESPESTESVRGQADGAHLSSIPESMFFDFAYNGRDASITSEIVFKGRQPFNPYKTPRVKNVVPGWEGVEGPIYQPGQLLGWDGNWQEAPVEWDRRDLYDYTAEEHQQNVKKFIDDRHERYDAGGCPPLDVTADKLFLDGSALATGLPYLAKPIHKDEHRHEPPDDPFSQGKRTKTAAMAIQDYLRVHAKRLKEQETRAEAVAEKKKTAKAQRAAEREARELAIAEELATPNPYEPKLNFFIRPAEPKDIPQICEIHNSYIRISAATGERVELTEREWRTRFDTCGEDRFPFLVAILARYSKMNRRQGRTTEHVVGFSYVEDFAGEQTMWCHTCELQIFVHEKYLHKGIGKNLMDCILRGVDPNYQARNAVEFVFTPGENERYEGGGVRVISNIIFPLPFTDEEDAKAQWIGKWLEGEFGFKLQGNLVGIGRVRNRRVNLAYYVAATGASI